MALHDPRPTLPRTPGGLFVSTGPAIERFAAKCRFDPVTGCVLWTGGTTAGRGNSAKYGSFWYEGRRWFAHRWAAAFIHGLAIGGAEVGHCCPEGPNTLCVQHLEPTTKADNLAEQIARGTGAVGAARKAEQSAQQRQFWLFVQLGIEPEPEQVRPLDDELGQIPFFEPPEWYRPYAPKLEIAECPF